MLEKVPVDIKDANGNTPLHVASNKEVVVVLLVHGALLSTTNEEQLVPIQTIAQRNNAELLEFLLAKHTPEALEEGLPQHSESTPNMLFWALRNKIAPESIEQIIYAFPQFIKATTNAQENPLHIAAAHGQVDIIKLLLGKEVPANALDATGKTPLQRASELNHEDIAAALGIHVDLQEPIFDCPSEYVEPTFLLNTGD